MSTGFTELPFTLLDIKRQHYDVSTTGGMEDTGLRGPEAAGLSGLVLPEREADQRDRTFPLQLLSYF